MLLLVQEAILDQISKLDQTLNLLKLSWNPECINRPVSVQSNEFFIAEFLPVFVLQKLAWKQTIESTV
jgi:hypothetical protein